MQAVTMVPSMLSQGIYFGLTVIVLFTVQQSLLTVPSLISSWWDVLGNTTTVGVSWILMSQVTGTPFSVSTTVLSFGLGNIGILGGWLYVITSCIIYSLTEFVFTPFYILGYGFSTISWSAGCMYGLLSSLLVLLMYTVLVILGGFLLVYLNRRQNTVDYPALNQTEVTVNDCSSLWKTEVARVFYPWDVQDIIRIVKEAKRLDKQISVQGTHNSMGGQGIVSDSQVYVIDMKFMSRVDEPDFERGDRRRDGTFIGTVDAEAGASWWQIIQKINSYGRSARKCKVTVGFLSVVRCL